MGSMKQCSPRAQSTMSGLPLTLLTVSSVLLILGSVSPAESEVSLMSQNPVAAWFENMMGIETNPVSRIRRDAHKKEEQKSKIGRKKNGKKQNPGEIQKDKKNKKNHSKNKMNKNDSKKSKNKKNKKKKNKNKKNKKKKHKNKKNKNKNKNKLKQSVETCSADTANRTCMAAALESMLFEMAQIANYFKQSKTLERHQTVSGNKAGKKDIFKEAEDHLLWAIGGNFSNPKCGPDNSSGTASTKYNSTLYAYEKDLALKSYATLKNCSVAIHHACNITNLANYDYRGFSDNITLCRAMKQDAIDGSKRCQQLTTNVSAQCECWMNQTIVISRIKEFKCQAKSNQKLVTQFKNNCINTFKECKQTEDKSIESVYYCMDDHSMSFINQTKESLANAAAKDARVVIDRMLGDEFALKEYLSVLDKY